MATKETKETTLRGRDCFGDLKEANRPHRNKPTRDCFGCGGGGRLGDCELIIQSFSN
jgi:hypothetical protein